jgi:hypothetical protein
MHQQRFGLSWPAAATGWTITATCFLLLLLLVSTALACSMVMVIRHAFSVRVAAECARIYRLHFVR